MVLLYCYVYFHFNVWIEVVSTVSTYYPFYDGRKPITVLTYPHLFTPHFLSQTIRFTFKRSNDSGIIFSSLFVGNLKGLKKKK